MTLLDIQGTTIIAEHIQSVSKITTYIPKTFLSFMEKTEELKIGVKPNPFLSANFYIDMKGGKRIMCYYRYDLVPDNIKNKIQDEIQELQEHYNIDNHKECMDMFQKIIDNKVMPEIVKVAEMKIKSILDILEKLKPIQTI